MRVNVRVIAELLLALGCAGLAVRSVHTVDLQLVPQLRLALPLPFAAVRAGRRHLTCMYIALAFEAREAFAIIVYCAWSSRRSRRWIGYACFGLAQPLCFLLL